MSFATTLFFGFSFGTMEMLVIGVVGLLMFGRRLPEVGRSLGKTFFEVRRGMNDIKREMDVAEELADDKEFDAHYRDQSHDFEHDHGHHHRLDDEEIVREAQAFGESVVDRDESTGETSEGASDSKKKASPDSPGTPSDSK